MKHYVVGMVFDKEMKHVLMLLRNKEPYNNLYNGVGGKIEIGETPEQAMVRELVEETGIKTEEYNKVYHLTTLTFHQEVKLDVFYLVANQIINGSHVWKETREGTLAWLEIEGNNLLDASNPYMAGDGNIAYFLQYAMNLEKKKLMKESG